MNGLKVTELEDLQADIEVSFNTIFYEKRLIATRIDCRWVNYTVTVPRVRAPAHN